MKKIAFICQVFYPDMTSTSQLFTRLLEDMAEKARHRGRGRDGSADGSSDSDGGAASEDEG